MLIQEAKYLEHYGVKGMKWGVRNDRSGRTDFGDRSTGQKVAIVGVGAASASLGATFVGGMTMSPVLSGVAAASAAKVGVSWTENYFDRKN